MSVASQLMATLAAGSLALSAAIACTDDGTTPTPATDAAGGQGGGGDGGSGGSLPVGAQLPCPAGELPLDDGSCQPAGVPADGCGQGFEPDGEHACRPVLPAAPCAAGRMVLPGEPQCRPIAPCGAGTWGSIPVDGTAQYVDDSYAGGNSDGSSSRPWTSVQAGIDAAEPGAIAAIAAGSYVENVVVDRPVRLWGVCPEQVALRSPTVAAAVEIRSGAPATEVRDLAVTGQGAGVAVRGAAGVLLDRVWIHDTDWIGLDVRDAAGAGSVAVRRSLFEAATAVALFAEGGSLTVEETVVRETAPDASNSWGRGISVVDQPASGQRAVLLVRRSVVASNHEMGIVAWGADATVEDTLVRDTQPRPSDQRHGEGIEGLFNPVSGQRTSLAVRGTVVERSHYCGVCVTDADLVMERTVVRDTASQAADDFYGHGVHVYGLDAQAGQPPTATIRASVIERSHIGGLVVRGAGVVVDSTIVRDTAPRASDQHFGRGVEVAVGMQNGERTSIELRGCVVERSYDTGVLILGSDAVIDATAVRDTRSRAVDGLFGTGITFQVDLDTLDSAQGSVDRSLVERAHAAGVAVLGADVTIENVIVRDTLPQDFNDDYGDGIVASSFLILLSDLLPTNATVLSATVDGSGRAGVANFAASVYLGASLLECNTIQLDGEPVKDEPFDFHDLGDNLCRCGQDVATCTVLTSNLKPPGAP